jgi:hypothetical protein
VIQSRVLISLQKQTYAHKHISSKSCHLAQLAKSIRRVPVA